MERIWKIFYHAFSKMEQVVQNNFFFFFLWAQALKYKNVWNHSIKEQANRAEKTVVLLFLLICRNWSWLTCCHKVTKMFICRGFLACLWHFTAECWLCARKQGKSYHQIIQRLWRAVLCWGMLQVLVSEVLVRCAPCVIAISLLLIYKIICMFSSSIGESGWKWGGEKSRL